MKRIIPIGLFLLWALPASATINLANSSTSTDITSSGATVTIPSTTAGNSVIVALAFRTASADTATSITDGGDTFTSRSRSTNAGDGRAQEIWVCDSISAGITSLTINFTTTGHTVTVTEFEYHSTLGQMTFDVGAGSTNGTSGGTTTYTGPSINTTKLSDLLFTYYASHSSSVSSIASPFSTFGTDAHSNTFASSFGQASGTYAPVWTINSADTSINNGIVALSEFECPTCADSPTFSPDGGTYGPSQTVTISSTSGGAIICWNTTGAPATNGTNGCTTGTLYSGTIAVSSNETLYAVAGGTGFMDSSVISAAYVIGCNIPLTYCGQTDTSSYSAAPPTLGAAGTNTTDTDFHSVSLRVTQSGSCSEAAGGSFSANGGNGWNRSWEKNDSKVLVNSETNNWYYQGIDTTTSPISFTGSCVSVTAKLHDTVGFSQATANLMYGYCSHSGSTLCSWDTVPADSATTITDFASIPGFTLNSPYLLVWDNSDAWFCITNTGQDSSTQIGCYNKSNGNTQVLNLAAATEQQNSGSPVALDNLTSTQLAGCGTHTVVIGLDGTWMFISMNGCSGFPDGNQGEMFWQLGTNHVTWVPTGAGIYSSSHLAMGYNGAFINSPGDQPPCPTYGIGWKYWLAPTPGTFAAPHYSGLAPCIDPTEQYDDHLTWANNVNDANANAYPVIGMGEHDSGANSNGYLEWEIVALETGPALTLLNASTFETEANGRVWRLGHTFNTTATAQCSYMTYVSPNVSPSGKYISYTSDYEGGTGTNGDCTNNHRTDVFVLDATSQGSGPTPPSTLAAPSKVGILLMAKGKK